MFRELAFRQSNTWTEQFKIIFLRLAHDSCQWKDCDLSTASESSSGDKVDCEKGLLHTIFRSVMSSIFWLNTIRNTEIEPITERVGQLIIALITKQENVYNKCFSQTTPSPDEYCRLQSKCRSLSSDKNRETMNQRNISKCLFIITMDDVFNYNIEIPSAEEFRLTLETSALCFIYMAMIKHLNLDLELTVGKKSSCDNCWSMKLTNPPCSKFHPLGNMACYRFTVICAMPPDKNKTRNDTTSEEIL